MSEKPAITELSIRRNSTVQSFMRGEDYYAVGVVRAAARRGMTLEAQVEGSQYTPYRVAITLDEAGIRSISCTCPYEFGGYCKHQVAVLLTYVRQPEVFAPQPDHTALLHDLSVDQLRAVLITLLDQKPELSDWVRVTISSLTASSPAAPQARPAPADTAAFRRQVQRVIGQMDYRHHWESIWEVVGALEEVHAQAKTFLQNGDYVNALVLMRVLGEEVVPEYGNLEEETQLADFLSVWSDDLTEAILGARLSGRERAQFSATLTDWAAELSDYGLDETLDKPITACERGWDAPPADLTDEDWMIDLTGAQLNVLERQGDTEAYLKLCLERGAHYRYARRLAEQGQTEKATEHALHHPMPPGDYLQLARFLRGQGQVEAAYQVGTHGLSSGGDRYDSGKWLAELAESLGRTEAARQAWQSAFDHSPSLEAYQHLKRLAGDTWAALRPTLIARLRQMSYQNVLIEVLIADQEIDEAITVWDSSSYGDYHLLNQLVDAAGATRPDWAVQQALKEARGLIIKGSKYYPHAVRWLGKVKRIYAQHNRTADWQKCLGEIRLEHGRKYSLMEQMKSLL